jgi:hypothetical protein
LAVAVAAGVVEIDPSAWAVGFDEVFAEVVAPFFFGREPRVRARG